MASTKQNWVTKSGAVGASLLKRAHKVADALRPGAALPGEGDTRFTPPPRPVTDGEDESPSTWGFADTKFALNADGQVEMSGDRYSIAGTPLPSLMPWMEGVMQVKLPPTDVNSWSYPPEIPAPKRNKAFLAEAVTFLETDQISEDGVTRLRHGHGHTQEEMFKIKYGSLPRVPDLVVFPSAESHIELLVQAAQKHDVCLIPYGGGTDVTDALRCRPEETRTIVSVDMRRMNRILWIDPVNRMARIEAGAVGRHIMEQLAEYGFTMGHEPDSVEFSTLGGWIATHASGMKKNKYGNIEDLVLDVDAVTTAGKIERRSPKRAPTMTAPRESIGADATRALFGSEGRLGIITSAVVKLFPLPEVQRYGSIMFRDFEHGVAFMYELSKAGNPPASVRLVDNLQFQFSMALKPASTGMKARKSKLQKLFVTKLKGFDPDKMVACTLVFEGGKREVAAQEESVYRIAAKHGGLKAGGENGERGYQLTYGIAYIRDFAMNHYVLGESFETSVPWSQALSLAENVKKRVTAEHKRMKLPGKPFVTARVTQIYETGCAIYFYFAFYYKGVAKPTETYIALENVAREEILKQGGSLSHHHGIGKLRQHFLPEILSRATLEWNDRTKRALDPDNIFGSANQAVDVPEAAPLPTPKPSTLARRGIR